MTLYFGIDEAGAPVSRQFESLRGGLHVVGVMGSGKTTLLTTMSQSWLREGGLLVIDPEGSMVRAILDLVPAERAGDVLYWDPANQSERPWAGNLWRETDPDKLHLTADWFKAAIRSLNPGEWSVNIDQSINAATYSLALGGGTIYDIPRFFRDRAFRLPFYETLRALNPAAYDWIRSYDDAASTRSKTKLSAEQDQMAGPLIRRVERLTTNPLLARIFGQKGITFDLGQLMAEGKILLVRLNDADLGPGVRQVLSNLLIGQLERQTLNRSPEDPPFLVIVDEVNTVITEGWMRLIERGRQHQVALVLAHQHFGRLQDDIKATLLVIPNRIAFQLAGSDVRHVAASFPDDKEIGVALRALPRYRAMARLDNDLDQGFSVLELHVAPSEGERYGLRDQIVSRSASLGRSRAEVDQELTHRTETEYEIEETVHVYEPQPLWGDRDLDGPVQKVFKEGKGASGAKRARADKSRS